VTGLDRVYDPEGDALVDNMFIYDNMFIHNGYYHNPGNADYGRITLEAGQPQNCFSGNVAPDGSAFADLEFID